SDRRRPSWGRPMPSSTGPWPTSAAPPESATHPCNAGGMTMTARGLSPLPPVEKVRPGLWSVPVPLPNNSLRYVLVYVFETDRGPYLVDAGWNTDDAYAALDAGLGHIGSSISDVQGVLVTHIHPDHYGLAGRVREASGAWV